MLVNPDIQTIIENHLDPYTHKTWGEMNVIRSLTTEEGKVRAKIELGYPISEVDELITPLKTTLLNVSSVQSVDLEISSVITSHAIHPGLKTLKGVPLRVFNPGWI